MNPAMLRPALGLLVATLAPSAAAQQPLVITNVRLIDGSGSTPITRATIVIRGSRIEAAGPGVRPPAGSKIIPGDGLTAIPGLADLHTHLAGGWDGEAVDFVGYRRMLGALLYAGVTTVLDPGDVTSWVKQLQTEIGAGRLQGPRIYFAGPVLDGPRPVWPDISAAIATPAQLPHFLDGLKAAGASFVKAYGGLSDSMVRSVVDSARARSLRVIADVWGRNGSLATAQTGIAAFAHVGGAEASDAAVKYQADHGVATITTLAVRESFARRRFREMSFLDQPLLAHVMPPSYLAEIRAWAASPAAAPDSATARRFPVGFRNVKKLFDAGVLLVAGTDAPYPGDYYGEGLHRELELLVEAGLTPLQAITAATGNAAKFIGPAADWGVIAPGKAADLVLVRGDPSVRVGATRDIVTVVQGGRVVDRARLRYDPRTEPDFHPSPLRTH
jgi:imidazolonepropionase-like amidohydrolase